jgi:hypothetical protein
MHTLYATHKEAIGSEFDVTHEFSNLRIDTKGCSINVSAHAVSLIATAYRQALKQKPPKPCKAMEV